MVKKVIRLFTLYRRYLRSRRLISAPIVYYDIGSAGYMPLPLRLLHRDGLLVPFGFDPGEHWTIPIQEVVDKVFRCKKVTQVPIAVSDRDGEGRLYLTRHPGCSSLRRPDAKALAAFNTGGFFDVVKEVGIPMRRLDSYVRETGLPPPTILKMDVQGAEEFVLNGAGDYLDGIVAIEMEVRMRALYEGERTFSDHYSWLLKKGFILKELTLHQVYEREAIEYMAYFARIPRSDFEDMVVRAFMAANGIALENGIDTLLKTEGHLLANMRDSA